jgi:hypothetical protein
MTTKPQNRNVWGTARSPNSEIVDHSISIVMNVAFGVALK